MKHKPTILLGDNHRKGISTALSLLDQMLCQVEQYAHGRQIRSVLYVERNALSANQKKSLLAEIAQMRHLLKELKDALGLEAKTEDAGRKIWGQGSTFWEILVETKSRFLKRYGQPPDGLAEYLDPRIDLLIEHLRNLTELARCEQ
jgi:hypothetical protein